jgi:hypothetical protein
MSDVLQTAMKYQSRLKSELTKVNDFLRMADEFLKKGEPSDSVMFFKAAPNSGADEASSDKSTDRPRSVSGGTSGAA